MIPWLRQIPGFRSRKWWKAALAVIGYAVFLLLLFGGLLGGAAHHLTTKVLGFPVLGFSFTLGKWLNAWGPPYPGTRIFLWMVYVLNARASTFLLGAESLAVVLLAANAWGVRSKVPLMSSRSKLLAAAGWVVLLFLFGLSLASTWEKRPWGFLNA